MSEEIKRVLDMLEKGKISAPEAEKLISALKGAGAEPLENLAINIPPPPPPPMPGFGRPGARGKYLKIEVRNGEETVDVRVPLDLIRAGMKLTSLVPAHVMEDVTNQLRDKGIELDLNNIKKDTAEALISALSDLKLDVKDGEESVRLYVSDQP